MVGRVKSKYDVLELFEIDLPDDDEEQDILM